MADQTSLRPDRIYLYECADGIHRHRCGAHVELTGPLRAVRVEHMCKRGGKWTCIRCEMGRYSNAAEGEPCST